MGLIRGLSSLLGGGNTCGMPSEEEVFGTELSEEADAFLTACNTEFNQKQESFAETWLTDCANYHVDFEGGVLRFTQFDGSSVLFEATLVGSHDRSGGSWEWAWNNPNAEPSVSLAKSVLAQIGEEFDLRYLLSGFVPVPFETFPPYLCGIAMKVTDALAVHVVNEGDMEYYLLLRNPSEAGL